MTEAEVAQGRASEPGVIVTIRHTDVRPGDYLIADEARVVDVQPAPVVVTLSDGRVFTLAPGVVWVQRASLWPLGR